MVINKSKKELDNMNNKIRYYKNKYGYIIEKKNYNQFLEYLPIIKKVYFLHDFICIYPQHKIPYHLVDYYAKNYDLMKLGYSIKHYLLKLKKIDLNQNHDLNENKNHNQNKNLLIF